MLNRLGSETLLSSAVLTDLGNTAFSIASEQVHTLSPSLPSMFQYRNLTPVLIPQGLPVDAALQRGLKVGIQPRIKSMHDSKLTRCHQDACLAFMGQEAASGLQVLPPGNAATNSRRVTF